MLKQLEIPHSETAKVGAKAFKNVNVKCSVYVHKAKLKAYKKLLKDKGLPKKAGVYRS